MKVGELIERLKDFDLDIEVRTEYLGLAIEATNVYEEVEDGQRFVLIE